MWSFNLLIATFIWLCTKNDKIMTSSLFFSLCYRLLLETCRHLFFSLPSQSLHKMFFVQKFFHISDILLCSYSSLVSFLRWEDKVCAERTGPMHFLEYTDVYWCSVYCLFNTDNSAHFPLHLCTLETDHFIRKVFLLQTVFPNIVYCFVVCM